MVRTELRQMLESGEQIVAPAVYDAITARLMRHLGFNCLLTPGSSTGIHVGEGEPMLSFSQMAEVVEKVSEGVDDELPIITDIMAGFGNPIHTQLAVRAMEAAGSSAVHCEDQLFPNRVHYFKGVEHVVSLEEYQQRIEFAVKAKRSKDFVIIARNDVYRAVEGGRREQAVQRAHAALEVGADAILITGAKDQDDLEYFRKQIKNDIPMVAIGGVLGGAGLSLSDWKNLGYQVVLFINTIHVSLWSIKKMYETLKQTGLLPQLPKGQAEETRALIYKLLEFEEKWSVEAATTEAATKK